MRSQRIIMENFYLKSSRVTISKARRLRKEMTKTERKLWSLLRDSQLKVHFRRQVPLGPYILDFFCLPAKLAVEVDGSQHYDKKVQKYDSKRYAYLRKQGLTVLRFNDKEFLNNPKGVLQMIYEEVQKRLGP